MTASAIGRYAEAPPDPLPTIWDDQSGIVDALTNADIPDFLADALAELMQRNYSPYALEEFARQMRKTVNPIVDRYARLMSNEEELV